jgi:hypothetical protein
VAEIMAIAQANGVTKMSFVSVPATKKWALRLFFINRLISSKNYKLAA